MRNMYSISCLFLVALLGLSAAMPVRAQARETYTGAVISFGSGRNTRTTTSTFTLTITGVTSDDKAQRYLGLLQDGGQDAVLDAIRKEEVGYFAIGGNLSRTINVVRESTVDGKLRIFAVFERWMQFAELRGGYRSIDYPFGVIEIFVDPKTGKGDGTYIAAAQVRWRLNKKTGEYQVEIENFATYPARLMGVVQRDRKTL
jgi:hypothetical protein